MMYRKSRGGEQTVLVITGVNGLKYNWVFEVEKHSGATAHILGYKEGTKTITTARKRQDLRREAWEGVDFLITNAESLRDTELTKLLSEAIANGSIDTIIADEIQEFRNPSSIMTKGLMKLKPKRAIGLTGTVLKNSPLDAYIPLRFIGEAKESFTSFKRRYCICEKDAVLGYRNLPELAERINEVSLRRMKADVLDLPAKTIVLEHCELGPPQRKLYEDVTKLIMEEIDKVKLFPDPRAMTTRLKQAVLAPQLISSSITTSCKMERALELAEEAIFSGQKVCVFTLFAQVAEILAEKMKHLGVLLYTGRVSESGREEAKKKFMEDPASNVLIGTIKAMGIGLTLTAASVVIFTDEPWTNADEEQAIDRCYRIGQTLPLTVYILIGKDTADERVRQIVIGKKALSDFIVDGKADNISFIKYLIRG
jgi:SNF2 family DNA or RNA helicase